MHEMVALCVALDHTLSPSTERSDLKFIWYSCGAIERVEVQYESEVEDIARERVGQADFMRLAF